MAFPNVTQWIQEGLEMDGRAMVVVPVSPAQVDFDEVNAAIKLWLAFEGWAADISYNIDDPDKVVIMVEGVRTDTESCRHYELVEAERIDKQYIQLRCAVCEDKRGRRYRREQ